MVTTVTVDSEYVASRLVDYKEAKGSGETKLSEKLGAFTFTDEEGYKFTVNTRDILNSRVSSSVSDADIVVGVDNHGMEFKEEVKEMTVDEIDGEEIQVEARFDGKTGWSSSGIDHQYGEEVTIRIKFV